MPKKSILVTALLTVVLHESCHSLLPNANDCESKEVKDSRQTMLGLTSVNPPLSFSSRYGLECIGRLLVVTVAVQ